MSPPTGTTCVDASGNCTLRAAVEAATNDPAHVYNIVIPAGMNVTLTEGNIPVANSMYITSPGATVTAAASNNIFSIDIGSAQPAVELSGLTLTGGSGSTGGAIDVENAAVTLTGVTVANNAASSEGGGVFLADAGSLWLLNSTVSGNTAPQGGGLYLNGRAFLGQSTISANTAKATNQTIRGGGLVVNDGTVQLDNTVVTGNSAQSDTVNGDRAMGGGIYADESLAVNGGSIDHNTVTGGGYGAGVANDYVGSIANSVISNNSITEAAGAAHQFQARGAGIYDNGSAFDLTNAVLDSNRTTVGDNVDTYGGAIYSGDDAFDAIGVTISNTSNDASAAAGFIEGGGFYNDNHVSLKDVSITNTTNTSGAGNDVQGGALSNEDNLDATGVTIAGVNNTAGYIGGGAIYINYHTSLADLSISHVTNHGSDANGGEVDGGAIYINDHTTLDGVRIDSVQNTADLAAASTPSSTGSSVYGGAVYNDYENTWNEVSMTNITSVASGGNGYVEGGFLDDESDGDASTMNNVQMVGGAVTADQGVYGGGWYADSYVTGNAVTVGNLSVTVLGGSAVTTPYVHGAALWNGNPNTLTNFTAASVTDSVATAGTPASNVNFGVENDYVSLTLTNATVANVSLTGGGTGNLLFTDSGQTTVLKNTILASGSPATNCGGTGTLTDAGHNLDNGTACGFTKAGDIQGANPNVLPLADNGGPVQTAALAAGSPAIDAGSNAGCPSTDARGVSRPQGGFCDIGAYESTAQGYWMGASDGGIFSFGVAHFYGSLGAIRLNQPVTHMVSTPDHKGYWLVAYDGGVFAFGDARFFGSTGGVTLSAPIVGIAPTTDGGGYWLVGSDGRVYPFGDALNFGGLGAVKLKAPIVGIAATPDGKGYWLVASDGGIFAFGDAGFFGSTGAMRLNKPIVGIATTADGMGYWLVATDGGIFAFGDAGFFGSAGAIRLNQPVVAMASTPTGLGYWLFAKDGGVFSYGDAQFLGSMGGVRLTQPMNAGASAS